MPIEKGAEWGHQGVLPADAPIATSDHELASFIGRHEVVGLRAGDLARTLGVRQDHEVVANRSGPKQLLPIDAIGVVLDDGSEHLGVAHLLVGSMLWTRRSIAVMNAAFINKRNVAPRAHPGDGKVDVVHFDLALTDRVKAWRRMPSGSHVPHPAITVRRIAGDEIELGSPQPITLDGQSLGRARRVCFTLIPAAITVAV